MQGIVLANTPAVPLPTYPEESLLATSEILVLQEEDITDDVNSPPIAYIYTRTSETIGERFYITMGLSASLSYCVQASYEVIMSFAHSAGLFLTSPMDGG